MKQFSKIILSVLSVCLSTGLYAQFTPDLSQIVKAPVSPEAAAFTKYGNSPVNLYTGTPSLTIPLGVVNGRSIDIPLALTYDASGIKVEQLSTWVGLGWNLNVGGVVSRMANGLPDDYELAYPEYSPYYSTKDAAWLHANTPTQSTKYLYDYFLEHQLDGGGNPLALVEAYRDYFNAKEASTVDFQPDLYSFSVMGLAGTLFIDYETGTGVCLEHPDLVVAVDLQPGAGLLDTKFGIREVRGWTITDSKGTVYEFTQIEKTEFSNNMDTEPNQLQSRTFNSAWYCTKITTANDRDEIEFIYTSPQPWDNVQFVSGNHTGTFIGTQQQNCVQPPVSLPINSATYKIWQFDMTHIKLNGVTRVTFDLNNPATPREDLLGRSRLEGVRILNIDGSERDHIVLNQTYFTNGGVQEWDKRLKLNSVQILGANDAALSNPEMLQTYSFTYHEQFNLRSRDSFEQDFWGYFNGANGNNTAGGAAAQGTLIPADPTYDDTGWSGADRSPSFDHAIIGTIKTISYPTGGTSTYSFQPNYVSASNGTNATASSYYKEVRHGGTIWDGAADIDPNNDFDLACGGASDYYTVEPTIYKSPQPFRVPEDDIYDILYTLVDDTPTFASEEVEFVFVYKGDERTLCDLVQNPGDPDIIFWDTEEPDLYFPFPSEENPAGKKRVFMEADVDYRILAASNSDIIRLDISREERFDAMSGGQAAQNVQVGGFRVYKIEDKPDPVNVAKTRYFYYDALEHADLARLNDNYFKGSSASSGVLQVPLRFWAPAALRGLNGTTGTTYTCDYVQRFSNNLYKLKPHVVTYSKVIETVSDGDNYEGFTLSEFYNVSEASVNPRGRVQRNGRLISETIYDEDLNPLQLKEFEYETQAMGGFLGFYLNSELSGIYNLRWEQSIGAGALPIPDDYRYYYNEMGVTGTGGSHWAGASPGIGYTKGWSGGTTMPKRCDLAPNPDPDCLKAGEQAVYTQVNYGISRGWTKLKEETTTSYYEAGEQMIVTDYEYHPALEANFNIKATRSLDSEGSEYITKFTYPQDLAASEGQTANIYNDLLTANRVSEVVRTELVKIVNGNEVPLQKMETQFKAQGVSAIVPDVLFYETNGGGLLPRIEYKSYDLKQNPVWLVKDEVHHVKYQWDHDDRLMVMNLSGIDNDRGGHTNILEYAYTSFETDEKGGWSYGINFSVGTDLPSGMRYFPLDFGSITKTLDVDETYTLAFWARGSQPISVTGQSSINPTSEWKYYEFELSDMASLSISSTNADIDELRLFSVGTQMTTYAYDEAERIISQIAPSGITTHYEYDALGRLSKVKDHEGNILKLMKYGLKSVMGN